jgi:nucleotide-binding universal stress UspA family protein
MKMANLLMPNFKSLPLELICVKPLEDNLHLPDNKLIKELLKRHYNNIEFTILKGIPEVEIINHLNKDKSNFMLILGAYRRTMLSRWFKSSMADAIIKSFNAPLFISHNK